MQRNTFTYLMVIASYSGATWAWCQCPHPHPLYHWTHYSDVIMGTIASQITSLTIVYSTVYSDADQRKHQSSASLAFVRGIHRGPVNSPHKWPVTRKCFHLMTTSWSNWTNCWIVVDCRRHDTHVTSTRAIPLHMEYNSCCLFSWLHAMKHYHLHCSYTYYTPLSL